MDENELKNCCKGLCVWDCPVESCGKVLSRRQTLQTHLSSIHSISAGRRCKKYKMYETDASVPVPRSTRYSQMNQGFEGRSSIPTEPECMLDQEGEELTSAEVSHISEGAEPECMLDQEGEELTSTEVPHISEGAEPVCMLDQEGEELTSTEVPHISEGAEPECMLDQEGEELTSTEVPHISEGAEPECMLDQEGEELTSTEVPHISEGEDSDMDISSDSDQETEESSSDESEKETLEIHSKDIAKPPVYVIPPSTEVYKCKIGVEEHCLLPSAFATHNNLSDCAFKSLISMIKLYLPDSNLLEDNIQRFKESCGFNSDFITHHVYCKVCNKLYTGSAEICQTTGCQAKKNKQCYFITGNVFQQIADVLKRPGLWDAIRDSKVSPGCSNIADIKDGTEYRKLKEPGCFLHENDNITLSLFTDGVSLFKSTCVCIWPVYLLINEIPAKDRFSKKNMILWGVWQGRIKPKMNMFLRPLVTDLCKLFHEGISWEHDSTQITTKVMLTVLTMDLPARSGVLQMTQHNGECSCIFCLEPGKVVKSGAGHCRSFPDKVGNMRTDTDCHLSAKEVRLTSKRVNGFLSETVLFYLPYFSITKNIVIDYMHGILLGITKKLLTIWMDSKCSKEAFYIGNKVTEIDKRLKSIQPPYYIDRLPRKIANNYQHWKASELRQWLHLLRR